MYMNFKEYILFNNSFERKFSYVNFHENCDDFIVFKIYTRSK